VFDATAALHALPADAIEKANKHEEIGHPTCIFNIICSLSCKIHVLGVFGELKERV
jgi:hypothetical protein